MSKFMFQAPLTGNEQALVRGIACLCHVIAEQHEHLVKHNHYGQPVPNHSSATAESAFWEYMGNDGFNAGEGGDGTVDRLWELVKPLVDEWKKMDDEGKEADAEREKKEPLRYTPIISAKQLLAVADMIREARKQPHPYGGHGSWPDTLQLDIRKQDGAVRVAFVQEDWDEDTAWKIV